MRCDPPSPHGLPGVIYLAAIIARQIAARFNPSARLHAMNSVVPSIECESILEFYHVHDTWWSFSFGARVLKRSLYNGTSIEHVQIHILQLDKGGDK